MSALRERERPEGPDGFKGSADTPRRFFCQRLLRTCALQSALDGDGAELGTAESSERATDGGDRRTGSAHNDGILQRKRAEEMGASAARSCRECCCITAKIPRYLLVAA